MLIGRSFHCPLSLANAVPEKSRSKSATKGMVDVLNDAHIAVQYPYQFEVADPPGTPPGMQARIGVTLRQQIRLTPVNKSLRAGRRGRLDPPRVLNYHLNF